MSVTLKTRLDNLNIMVGKKLNKLQDLKENKSNKLASLTSGVTDPQREYANIQAILDALNQNSLDDQGYTDSEISTALAYVADNYINLTEKGAANGVATLGGDGKVPSTQLPSFVDDVEEYDTKENPATGQTAFPATGEASKIYVALDTNKTWRWSGTAYVEISPSLVIGIVAGTAFEGNRGKALEDAMTQAQADINALESEFATYYKAMDGLSFPDYATELDNNTSTIIVA